MRKRFDFVISKQMIATEQANGLTPVTLQHRQQPRDCDEVRYRLVPCARRCYRFDPTQPASFITDGTATTPSVTLSRSGTQLTIRIDPDSDWKETKVSFHFKAHNGDRPDRTIDPIIRNGGRGGGGSG